MGRLLGYRGRPERSFKSAAQLHYVEAHLLTIKRHSKENDAFQSLLHQWSKERLELVDTPPTLTRQSRDHDAGFRVIGDEDRVHEHGLCELPTALPGA